MFFFKNKKSEDILADERAINRSNFIKIKENTQAVLNAVPNETLLRYSELFNNNKNTTTTEYRAIFVKKLEIGEGNDKNDDIVIAHMKTTNGWCSSDSKSKTKYLTLTTACAKNFVVTPSRVMEDADLCMAHAQFKKTPQQYAVGDEVTWGHPLLSTDSSMNYGIITESVNNSNNSKLDYKYVSVGYTDSNGEWTEFNVDTRRLIKVV